MGAQGAPHKRSGQVQLGNNSQGAGAACKAGQWGTGGTCPIVGKQANAARFEAHWCPSAGASLEGLLRRQIALPDVLHSLPGEQGDPGHSSAPGGDGQTGDSQTG